VLAVIPFTEELLRGLRVQRAMKQTAHNR
jgi:hypothetical protein